MSFFLQSKRNTDFPIKATPSPLDYSITPDPQSQKKPSYAPFNSTTKSNRSATKYDKKYDLVSLPEETHQIGMQVVDIVNPEIKMHSMFKSKSQRVVYPVSSVPGPGSYNIRGNYVVKNRGNGLHDRNLSAADRKINPPSIPTDNLGFKCNQDNKYEKVQPKAVNPPVPGSYQLRAELIKDKGLSWKVNPTISRKQQQQQLPGPGAYTALLPFNSTRAPLSSFASQSDRFNPKKIKKSLNPGPGQYQIQNINKKNHRNLSENHFNSKCARFSIDKRSALGPGSYSNANVHANKSLKTFNSKILEKYGNLQASRNTIFDFNNRNPGPGEYIAREGMTFQLQKALLRKHNFSQFPNSRREVFEPRQIQEPGPGAYEPQKLKSNPKGNIGYKKIDVINLKDDSDQQPTPSPQDYIFNNFSMSKKIEKSNKRLILTQKKPFNIGTERFDHYTNPASTFHEATTKRNNTLDTDHQSIDAAGETSINFEGQKRVKKLIMTSMKVKVPFGTSTSKFVGNDGFDVGPGSYDSGNAWIKQSHSIKSKLGNRK